jgi:hypothetical protein
MADSSPLAGLLDRAGNVFSLAGKLGRAFHEEGESRAINFDPSIWQHHAPTFNEFCAALLDLRNAMQNPPDGFSPVGERLLQAAKLAKGIRDTLTRDSGFTKYLDFFPDLNAVFQSGWEAVKEVTKAQQLNDPFAFVDEPMATTAFTLLDQFPATPAGHIAFLEAVRDEVHHAAEAKRRQIESGYSNAIIENMVRGIEWPQARARLAALSNLPDGMRANVGDVLHRELRVGTVEQIDALLTLEIRDVRDSFEQARLNNLVSEMVVVATAGDLWKTYAQGKRPCFQSSGISIRPGGNISAITCTDDAAEAKRIALDRTQALVTAEGGDKAAAMEKLIARVQLQAGLDKASVINMPLAEFMAAAIGAAALKNSEGPRTSDAAGLSQTSGLERLIAALNDELDDRETSIPNEFVSPQPLRDRELYRAVQIVERLYGGKLPVGPWQAWRGMLLRADEGKGEGDPNECYEQYYASCDSLSHWANLELARITLENSEVKSVEAAAKPSTPIKTKRSTERGEGRAKLIAALTMHHKYADGGCLNLEPIGNNELARLAEVSDSTASAFFNKKFNAGQKGGHAKYRAACGDLSRLIKSLKALNHEFDPHHVLSFKEMDDDAGD